MREGLCTANANRILSYKFLKLQLNSPKRAIRRRHSAASFCHGYRNRHFFAALSEIKSLKMLTLGFGRRAAIPDAWLISRYRFPIPHKCSRCLLEEVPLDSHRKANRWPRGRLALVLYSRACSQHWSEESLSRKRVRPVHPATPFANARKGLGSLPPVTPVYPRSAHRPASRLPHARSRERS
jgi:hypothetical protein